MSQSNNHSAPTPLPWQQEIWAQLSRQIQSQRLPHGLLLAGIEGVGKLRLAQVLAQRLLCLTQAAELACGRCKGCQLLAAGTHPDLLVLAPEAAGKAIKIDAVRAANDFLAKTAQQGGRKVVLISPAEAMTTAAANALLKSLEEPAGLSHVILVSHQTSSVLPTIRSRCRLLALGQPPVEQVLPWLTPLCTGRAEPAQLLALAGGAPLAARALLEDDRLERHSQLMRSLDELSGGQMGGLAAAEVWLAQEPLQILRWLQQWLAQLLTRLQLGQAGQDAVTERVADLLGAASVPLVHRFYDKLSRARQALAGSANPNPQLLLEELALDWQALCRASARRAYGQ